jgi:class 3 adenylate cyclase
MAIGYITVHPDSPQSVTVEVPDGTIMPIGRKPSPDGSPKLVIAEPEVSAQHAEIRATKNGWTILDTGSTNGTQLNEEWLTPGREYALKDGDEVKVADIPLLISMPHHLPKQEETEVDDRTYFRINLINATILVGDIRGFTSLMEHYASQPEVVMEAAHRVFQAISKEILSNHGQLEKIAGDAVLCYWQQDEERKNAHAYRACTTALRVRQLVMGALSKDKTYWPFRNHPLHLDIALATGPAAAGALGRKEANPALLGDTANLAFRMEKMISDEHPGDIVVEHATYELVNDLFVFEPLGQFNVRGRQKSVDVYRLLDTRRSETVEHVKPA